jgi:hypothetical protein
MRPQSFTCLAFPMVVPSQCPFIVGEDGAKWVTHLLFRDYSNMNGCRAINEVPNDRRGCCPQITTRGLFLLCQLRPIFRRKLRNFCFKVTHCAPVPGQTGSPSRAQWKGEKLTIFKKKKKYCQGIQMQKLNVWTIHWDILSHRGVARIFMVNFKGFSQNGGWSRRRAHLGPPCIIGSLLTRIAVWVYFIRIDQAMRIRGHLLWILIGEHHQSVILTHAVSHRFWHNNLFHIWGCVFSNFITCAFHSWHNVEKYGQIYDYTN